MNNNQCTDKKENISNENPHCSVMGPILFDIFINDLEFIKFIKFLNIIQFRGTANMSWGDSNDFEKLNKYLGKSGCNPITKFYTLRKTRNSGNTGCEIINHGRSSAVSGQGVIANPKLERNLTSLLLLKTSNIIFESEKALAYEVICLARVLILGHTVQV